MKGSHQLLFAFLYETASDDAIIVSYPILPQDMDVWIKIVKLGRAVYGIT
jgi:hypothetical protein